MGITVGPSYTTEQGIVLTDLYLSLNYVRALFLADGKVQIAFGVNGYMSREAKEAGRSPITLPSFLSTAEAFIVPKELLLQSLHGLAYTVLKGTLGAQGYTATDVLESGQFPANYFTYSPTGRNADGYDPQGFNVQGYNAQGYNSMGYNSLGYNAQGFNASGFNSAGYNVRGFNAGGYDMMGYNSDGFDKDGFAHDGYNAQGLDRYGNPRQPTE
jgi:hypothetical protein